MTFSDIAKRIGKFTADNSPAILTGIAVAGTLTTAYLTGKASFKAALMIDVIERREGVSDDPRQRFKERLKMVWPQYIPAIGVACMTIGCTLMSHGINTRRAAGMATAFALSERLFDEYRDKVTERIGESKERDIRDQVAQDRVTKTTTGLSEVVIVGAGSVLCFETFTGRYFLSSMEELRKAQNDLNGQVLSDFYASLTQFYNLIGLERTSYSDEVGWNADNQLELKFSSTLSTDGRPCLAIDYNITPIRDYYRFD